ncbi:hypothetical protein HQ535_14200 [bacterium]|nr:hypothetical protein [bacterium]
MGGEIGLSSGQTLVASEELEMLRDLIWELGAALDDVEQDLIGRPKADEYRRAFEHLHGAASQLRDRAPEPIAIGDADPA